MSKFFSIFRINFFENQPTNKFTSVCFYFEQAQVVHLCFLRRSKNILKMLGSDIFGSEGQKGSGEVWEGGGMLWLLK